MTTQTQQPSLLGDLSGLWLTRNGSFVVLTRDYFKDDEGNTNLNAPYWKGWILGQTGQKLASIAYYTGPNFPSDKGFDLMVRRRGEEDQSLQKDFVIYWPIVAPHQGLL